MSHNKLTFDYVKEYFESQGCQLLEKEYKNSQTKMKYVCSCGEESYTTWGIFKRGCRCKQCGIEKLRNKFKNSYGYVYNYFKEQNCYLLEKEYKNGKTKMRYICSCGNESEICWNNFQQGHRCQKCARNEKFTFEHVYNYFENYGCKLLEQEYINIATPMRYICNCGRESKISFESFKNGQRCRKCCIERNNSENHWKWNKNLTDDERIRNRDFNDYKKWRKFVYIKNNHTCQCCGTRGGNLNAHHLDGYNWCKEKRTDVNNGATLCEKCHENFHKIYGYGNNTKKQFNEFINNIDNDVENNFINCINIGD